MVEPIIDELGISHLSGITDLGQRGRWREYRALHEDLGDYVTLKVHHGHTKVKLHERYKGIHAALDRLDLPSGIQQPSEIGLTGAGTEFIVVPHIESPTMHEQLSTDPSLNLFWDPETAWKEEVDAIGAVAFTLVPVHDAGMSHGNLNPNTIIKNQRADPTITDFGLTSFETKRSVAAGELDPHAIPIYSAPEAHGGKPLTPRTDVYGLGISLWAALSGIDQVESADPSIFTIDLTSDAPHSDDVISVPAPILGVIHKAVSHNPKDRHRDAGEFLEALDKGRAAALAISPSKPMQAAVPVAAVAPSPASTSPGPQVRLGMLPGLVAAAFVLVGLGAYGALAATLSSSDGAEPRIQVLGTTTEPTDIPTSAEVPSTKPVPTPTLPSSESAAAEDLAAELSEGTTTDTATVWTNPPTTAAPATTTPPRPATTSRPAATRVTTRPTPAPTPAPTTTEAPTTTTTPLTIPPTTPTPKPTIATVPPANPPVTLAPTPIAKPVVAPAVRSWPSWTSPPPPTWAPPPTWPSATWPANNSGGNNHNWPKNSRWGNNG